jgi:capsular polysaccharide biosynthesis protein
MGVSLIGGGIVYMITQLHRIDKKVKTPEEINDMIDLKVFKHIEKCKGHK